jgi:hypothetical protein
MVSGSDLPIKPPVFGVPSNGADVLQFGTIVMPPPITQVPGPGVIVTKSAKLPLDGPMAYHSSSG